MEDPRVQQIKDQIEQNQEAVGTKFAFKGFGRSTDSAEALSQEAQKGQDLLAGLLGLLSAEENYKQALKTQNDKIIGSASNTLSSATQYFQKLSSEATKRRNVSIQDVQSYSQTVDRTPSDKINLGGKSTSNRVKLGAKLLSTATPKAKDLSKIKSAGSKKFKTPSLSKVPSSGARTKTLTR